MEFHRLDAYIFSYATKNFVIVVLNGRANIYGGHLDEWKRSPEAKSLLSFVVAVRHEKKM